MKRIVIIISAISLIVIGVIYLYYKNDVHPTYQKGDIIDEFNGVNVYYNGNFRNVFGRNIAKDGYVIGLKYQCVEFVKRYYYEYFNHKMPNPYGHAKDFFDPKIKDGYLNPNRNLIQYKNPSQTKPSVHDMIVFDGNRLNPFGHIAIICKVSQSQIEVIQQNMGTNTRDRFELQYENRKWRVNESSVLGWLHKP